MPSDLKLTAVEHAKEEAEQDIFRRLKIRKQNLLDELEFIQRQKIDKTSSDYGEELPLANNNNIHAELVHGKDSVELLINVDQSVGLLVAAVIVFAEGIFKNGESHAVHFREPSISARLPLPIQKIGFSTDLHINILLNENSTSSETTDELLQTIQLVKSLPTFARLKPVRPLPKESVSLSARYRIKLRLQERLQRVIFSCSCVPFNETGFFHFRIFLLLHFLFYFLVNSQIGFWIETNFISPFFDPLKDCEGPILLAFEILPWRTTLRLSFLLEGYLVRKILIFNLILTWIYSNLWIKNRKVIDSDRLDAASAVIQHLASFLNVQQLNSTIEISDEHMKDLVLLTNKVQDLQVIRQRLQIESANQVNIQLQINNL